MTTDGNIIVPFSIFRFYCRAHPAARKIALTSASFPPPRAISYLVQSTPAARRGPGRPQRPKTAPGRACHHADTGLPEERHQARFQRLQRQHLLPGEREIGIDRPSLSRALSAPSRALASANGWPPSTKRTGTGTSYIYYALDRRYLVKLS